MVMRLVVAVARSRHVMISVSHQLDLVMPEQLL